MASTTTRRSCHSRAKEERLNRLLTSAATLVYLGGVAAAISPSPSSLEPIKPPAAAYFNISVAPRQVKAGDTAVITVTVKLNDMPVPGATVRLAMLFTPGRDFRFVPGSGLTDAAGNFRATVRTSRNPGESVIAATSGVFSDQDQVVGSGPRGGLPAPAPAPRRDQVPLVVLGAVFGVLGVLVAARLQLGRRPNRG